MDKILTEPVIYKKRTDKRSVFLFCLYFFLCKMG